MNNNSKGYTVIELVVIVVLLSILMTIVAVKFTNFADSATKAALDAAKLSVKNAYAIALAKNSAHPTIAEIKNQLIGENAVAVPTGIEVKINQKQHVVLTYSDPYCSLPTHSISDRVYCVGEII